MRVHIGHICVGVTKIEVEGTVANTRNLIVPAFGELERNNIGVAARTLDIGQEDILIITASITSTVSGELISRSSKSGARGNKPCIASVQEGVDRIEDRATISCNTDWCERQINKIKRVLIDGVDIVNADGPIIKETARCTAKVSEVVETNIVAHRCWQVQIRVDGVRSALSKRCLSLLLVKDTLRNSDTSRC